MKVLCQYNHCGPSFVRTGWKNVFEYCGHSFRFWEQEYEPAMKVFKEYEPDLFIGTTYSLERALIKCIKSRPKMKVALFGSANGEVCGLANYPITKCTPEEVEKVKDVYPDLIFLHTTGNFIDYQLKGWKDYCKKYDGILNAADIFEYIHGKQTECFSADISFVGGYWPYKSRNLNNTLVRLAGENSGYNIKIFGNQPWPIPQYLGTIENNYVKDVFVSAKICPNISESHSTDLGFDIVERPFKVFSSGGFCISDYVEELQMILPDIPKFKSYQEFYVLLFKFLKDSKEKEELRRSIQKQIFEQHTYFDRVEKMLYNVNMIKEAQDIKKKKGEYVCKHQLL